MKGIILAGGAGSRLHPITESIHSEVLSLPISPAISEADLSQVVKSVCKFF